MLSTNGQRLYHVTMTTGHVAHQKPVAADLIDRLRPLVMELTGEDGGMLPIPGLDTYTVRGFTSAYPVFIVYGSPTDGQFPPLVTFGVGTGADTDADLWRYLHELATAQARAAGQSGQHGLDAQVAADAVPPSPWCGVVTHPPLFGDYESGGTALDWVADFEKHLAWTYIDVAEALP